MASMGKFRGMEMAIQMARRSLALTRWQLLASSNHQARLLSTLGRTLGWVAVNPNQTQRIIPKTIARTTQTPSQTTPRRIATVRTKERASCSPMGLNSTVRSSRWAMECTTTKMGRSTGATGRTTSAMGSAKCSSPTVTYTRATGRTI